MYPEQYFIVGLCEHLAWPVVVVICATLFKNDIRMLLRRIKTLPGGTQLDSGVVGQQEEYKKNFEELFAQKNEENKGEVDQPSPDVKQGE